MMPVKRVAHHQVAPARATVFMLHRYVNKRVLWGYALYAFQRSRQLPDKVTT